MMNGHKDGHKDHHRSQGLRESGVVGEHCGQRRRIVGRQSGASGKENVGMSNDNARENARTDNPRFPDQR